MSDDNKVILYKELSYAVIGACFAVHTRLGCALPEVCYNRALSVEFTNKKIKHDIQKKFDVFYDFVQVGHFFSDIVIDNKIILELKSNDKLTANHESQLFTYLRVSKLRVGYLVNFGLKSLQFKRLIL